MTPGLTPQAKGKAKAAPEPKAKAMASSGQTRRQENM